MLYFLSRIFASLYQQVTEKGIIELHFDCRPTMSFCWTQVLIGWKILIVYFFNDINRLINL